jgi:predicted hotdog family 3-hydroxylacyl-ACP dehydratase
VSASPTSPAAAARSDAAPLVPHVGDACLLDEVWQASPQLTCARVVVRQPTPFAADADGWPAWVAIELMAQVVAAGAGLRELRPGVRARLGLLLGVRGFNCTVATFAAGTRLQVQALESTRDSSGLGVFDCSLAAGGVSLASGVLTVYLPDSAEDYLESLEP